MLSKNKDWFTKSNYWQSWSRVLLRMGGDYPEQVEISLTPTNNDPDELVNLLQCRIRKHNTAGSPGDIYTHQLPEHNYFSLREKLGMETADFLMHADIYNMIDWSRYEQVDRDWVNGGGIPLILLVKDSAQLPEKMLDYWDKQGRNVADNYYRRLENRDPKEYKTVLKNTFVSLTCEFRRFIAYITDKEHVWDSDKYIPSRKCSGKSFGEESIFNFQYCLGNAYGRGFIGDYRFELYKTHDTIKLFLNPSYQAHSETPEFTCKPEEVQSLIDYVSNTVKHSPSL